jgi:hypothetical protein
LSLADIAPILAFAYPTYFNNFLNQIATTPLAWRKAAFQAYLPPWVFRNPRISVSID